MSDLVDYFEVTSSDPSVSLEDLPIDGSPVTFTGDSLTITFSVTNADVDSAIFTSITIVQIGVPNIDKVTVTYTLEDDPANPVTVVSDADPGTIDVPSRPTVTQVTLVITTLITSDETNFEAGIKLCFKNRGKLNI